MRLVLDTWLHSNSLGIFLQKFYLHAFKIHLISYTRLSRSNGTVSNIKIKAIWIASMIEITVFIED
jgi:hypothetical protein